MVLPPRFREMPLETLGRVMDAVLLALRAAKDDLDLALLPELVPSPAFPRPWTHTGGHRVRPEPCRTRRLLYWCGWLSLSDGYRCQGQEEKAPPCKPHSVWTALQWVIQNWFSIPRDEISTEALSLAGYAWCVAGALRTAIGAAAWLAGRPPLSSPLLLCSQLWIYPAGAPAGNGGSPGHLGFSLRFCDQGDDRTTASSACTLCTRLGRH